MNSATAPLTESLFLHRRWLIGAIMLGCLLRVVWALLVPMEPVSDSNAYHVFAQNIANHATYGWEPGQPTAYWAVGYSAIVAFFYWLFGVGFAPVIAFNIAVSVAVIFLVGALARAWFGDKAGLLAGAVIALWPSMILQTTVMSSEVLFIGLVVAALLVHAKAGKSFLAWIFLGLVLGLACYVRPVALLVPIVLAMSEIGWKRARIVPTVLGCGSAIAIILLLLSPWTYRNYTVFGTPVLVSTNFAANFWMGNNPDTTGAYQPLPPWVEGMGEIERADKLKEVSYGYIAEEPGAFVARTIVKLFKLHMGETIFVHWNVHGIDRALGSWAHLPLKAVASGYWYLVLLAGLAGLALFVARRDWYRQIFHPAVLMWAYFAAIHAVIVVGDRYHFPNIPFIVTLATVGMAFFFNQIASRTNRLSGGRASKD